VNIENINQPLKAKILTNLKTLYAFIYTYNLITHREDINFPHILFSKDDTFAVMVVADDSNLAGMEQRRHANYSKDKVSWQLTTQGWWGR
jgi:hypothetical protein